MAIAFDSATSPATPATNDGTTTHSWSHTCSGLNRILFVLADLERDSTQVITGCTYNGIAMTALYSQAYGTGRYGALFFLLNPPTGTHTVSLSISATTPYRYGGASTSYNGVAQTTPEAYNTTDDSASTVSSISTAVTTITDNAWVVGGTRTIYTPTAGVNTTSRATIALDDTLMLHDSNGVESPPGSYSQTVSQSTASNAWQYVVSIAPATTTLTSDLAAYWKLDGNSTDSVGSNNGTDTGVLYGTAYGKINQGVDVNNGYINVGTGLNNITAAITLQAWIYQTGNPASGYAVVMGTLTNTGPYGGWNINGGSAADPTIYFQVNSGSWTGPGGWPQSLNSWHHIVGTFDGTTSKLYVDGSLYSSLSQAGSIQYQNSAQPCYIGKNGGSGAEFQGYVDEVAVWSRALTATEVSQLYNSGAGLQYPFNPTSATPKIFMKTQSINRAANW